MAARIEEVIADRLEDMPHNEIIAWAKRLSIEDSAWKSYKYPIQKLKGLIVVAELRRAGLGSTTY